MVAPTHWLILTGSLQQHETACCQFPMCLACIVMDMYVMWKQLAQYLIENITANLYLHIAYDYINVHLTLYCKNYLCSLGTLRASLSHKGLWFPGINIQYHPEAISATILTKVQISCLQVQQATIHHMTWRTNVASKMAANGNYITGVLQTEWQTNYGCSVCSTGKPLCFASVFILLLLLLFLFKRYSPRSLNGLHSYFHTISGLGVI